MATSPVRHDVALYAGDTEVIEITVLDEGDPAVLTGATLEYHLSQVQGGERLASVNGSIAGSVGTVQIGAAVTAREAGVYWHEARLTEVSGRITTVMVGHLLVSAATEEPAP